MFGEWILGLFLIYAFLCLALYFFQDKFIFFPSPNLFPGHSNNELTIKTPEGVTLQAWWINPEVKPSSPLILYFGGNAEEVSNNLEDFSQHLGTSVLLVNYRGYGNSQGTPSEKSLKEDADFILKDWLPQRGWDTNQVILMGRSLGSGVAAYLASRYPVQRVILVTPFDSLLAIGKKHYPIFPLSLILRHRFDSISIAPQIKVPLLMILAENDKTIPLENSSKLFDAWGGPKKIITIPNSDHNDLHLNSPYWKSIQTFLGHLPITKMRN